MSPDAMIYIDITNCRHRQYVYVCALRVYVRTYVYVIVHGFKPITPSRAAGVKAGSVARGGGGLAPFRPPPLGPFSR